MDSRPCAFVHPEPVPDACTMCKAFVSGKLYAKFRGESPKPAVRPFPTGGVTRLPKVPRDSPPPTAPGTRLANLLSSLGVPLPAAGCKCKELAAKMNGWGEDGCKERRAEILTELRKNYSALGWADRLRIAKNLPVGLAARLALHPLDPASGILNEILG